MNEQHSIGIDFGTTNTVFAIANPNEPARALAFHNDGQIAQLYRSVLCFERLVSQGNVNVTVDAGFKAIKTFLNTHNEVRFLQSFKSHVASRLFESTQIFSNRYRFEDILSQYLQMALSDVSDPLPAMENSHIISGRPVSFVGENPDEELAMSRYATSYAKAGLPQSQYVYEPVGAAFYYAKSLTKDATILVGDFGGGTSDFSVIRFEVGNDHLKAIPLGHAGLGIAGDSFDYRIIDEIISPQLGKGSLYKSFDKLLEVPHHYYSKFAKWHLLSMLKNKESMRELIELKRDSTTPQALEHFINLVNSDAGYNIYSEVSAAKVALSLQESVEFSLKVDDFELTQTIYRADFENWISPDISKIEETLSNMLSENNVVDSEIDHVFLTGGSSSIPAVQTIFDDRFGTSKMADGNQFQSIAIGLAQIGLEKNLEDWIVR